MGVRATLLRLRAYALWWRVGLVLAAATSAGAAAVASPAGLSAVLAVLAAGFLAILIATAGSRVDQLHLAVRDLAAANHRQGLEIATLQAQARSPAVGAGDVSVLLPLQPRTAHWDRLDQVLEAARGAQVILIDRTGGGTVPDPLLEALDRFPSAVLVSSSPARDLVADLESVRRIASGAYVIAMRRGLAAAEDVVALAELIARRPASADDSVGAHVAKDGRLALVRSAALDATGGWTHEVGAADEVLNRLEAAGYRIDSVGSSEESRRTVHRSGLVHLQPRELSPWLEGRVLFLVDGHEELDAIGTLIERVQANGIEPLVCVSTEAWSAARGVLMRWNLPLHAIPTAGAWLESLACLVKGRSSADSASRSLVVTAEALGVAAIAVSIEGDRSELRETTRRIVALASDA